MSGFLQLQDRFVVVLATNIREILDRAVLDRVACGPASFSRNINEAEHHSLLGSQDENFEFPLPSLEADGLWSFLGLRVFVTVFLPFLGQERKRMLAMFMEVQPASTG